MDAVYEYFNTSWDYVKQQLSTITVSDLIDIALVSVLLYYIIKFIRDRRAGKLALGVLMMLFFQIISVLFDFTVLKFIMDNVFQVGILAIIIVFHPEIRSMLENVGGESLKSLKSIGEQKDAQTTANMIAALCEALCDLSLSKTGALVVIERTTKLGDIIRSGTVVNADMTPFLMKNIFFNKAPLHDGAVIMRDGRIYAAGCLLPLSQNLDIIKDLGTRHRAGIGMSENSDAVVLIVSEETGTISVAVNGQLKRNFDYASLRAELEERLLDVGARRKTVKHGAKREDGGESGGEA